MISLVLPFPPSLNTYWRHVVMGRAARVLISKEGRAYREAVGQAIMQQRPGRLPGERKLCVRMVIQPPDARRRDLDNYAKAVLDALTHAGVWGDDFQIDKLTLERGEKCQGGRLVLTIEPIPMALERCA